MSFEFLKTRYHHFILCLPKNKYLCFLLLMLLLILAVAGLRFSTSPLQTKVKRFACENQKLFVFCYVVISCIETGEKERTNLKPSILIMIQISSDIWQMIRQTQIHNFSVKLTECYAHIVLLFCDVFYHLDRKINE